MEITYSAIEITTLRTLLEESDGNISILTKDFVCRMIDELPDNNVNKKNSYDKEIEKNMMNINSIDFFSEIFLLTQAMLEKEIIQILIKNEATTLSNLILVLESRMKNDKSNVEIFESFQTYTLLKDKNLLKL